jgi:hypothetical protein
LPPPGGGPFKMTISIEDDALAIVMANTFPTTVQDALDKQQEEHDKDMLVEEKRMEAEYEILEANFKALQKQLDTATLHNL